MNAGLLSPMFLVSFGLLANQEFVIPDSIKIYDKFPRDNNQRRSSYPFISGDTFRSFCDYKIDETKVPFFPKNVKEGETIFVISEALEYFFSTIHPLICSKYILLTHNSDMAIPGKFAAHLDDNKLIAWFGQNVDRVHPKLFPIPIGFANRFWPHGNIEILNACLKNLPIIKKNLLYMNFDPGTHPQGRTSVYKFFLEKNFCSTCYSRKNWANYLGDLASSKFTISPRGNGLDCHRTWEALIMGCIPIVQRSSLDPLYEDLPVIIINDWSEVTEEFLTKKFEEMSQKSYKMEKLYVDFWIQEIKTKKSQFSRIQQ